MRKITFMEYIASKEKLREAIRKSGNEYTTEVVITRYCRLSVEGEDDKKNFINLKPGHCLEINWMKEEGKEYPVALNILFENVKNMDGFIKHCVAMENTNFLRWLDRNSTDKIL